MLKIISPIPPSVNNYLNYKVQRAAVRPGSRPKMFVQSYKSEDSLVFEGEFFNIAKQAVNEQKWTIPEKSKYVVVDCIFFFPKHGMDTNNHWKLPLDVLKTAGVYFDDSKVLEHARRVYIDAKNPRMELHIYESDIIGIFDNEDELEKFKAFNCCLCKKNPNRCSTMTKALENRVTGDINIDSMNCLKIKQ